MKKPRFGFAVAYVKDIAEARRFYVEVLGLRVERESPQFVQFESFAIASDEPMSGSNLELYWLVDDAEAAFRELSHKAELTLKLKQMPFGRVFGVRDPAGQPRYLLELAQDRPSRRVE